MSEDEQKSGVRIKDRRRFDAEGQERADADAEAKGTPEPKPESGAAAAQADPAEEPPVPITFASFALSLATQALMQLGHIEPPPGVSVTVDKAAARQSIDILTMLKEKTEGNLDKEEFAMLDELLHTLRMAFLR